MKRVLKVSLLPLMSVVFGALSGCQRSTNPVQLTYGEIHHQQYHQITYSQLNTMIDNKESFLLVVDPQNCGCFLSFMNASEGFIEENNLVLYYITVADFDGNPSHGIKVVSGNTSFAIFNKGEIEQCIVSNAATEIMRNEEKFVDYVTPYIKKPNMYFVSKNDLDTMYHSNKKSLVYFARNKCGDCTYVNGNFLFDYMREKEQIIYVFDGDDPVTGIRKYDDHNHLINPDEWNTFKEDYGLSPVKNPDYGYEVLYHNPNLDDAFGVVPTFFVVSGTETSTTFHSGAVAFNDNVVEQNSKYVIEQTYYSNERITKLDYLENLSSLEGKEISSEDLDVYPGYGAFWKQEKASLEHFPRLQAFLDKYLPQVTFTF